MFVTVIICTYRRATETIRLLQCIAAQSHRSFEVLVVDGSGDDRTVRESLLPLATEKMNVRIIESQKGLTRQRNVGLRHATGQLIVFLDDDVVIGSDFLERVVSRLLKPECKDVGGLTAYDTKNYPATPNLRWRLRRYLRVIASLEPGFADRLGRNVPISFSKPFEGVRTISWLPGFCMIYRRDAMVGLAFDEQLPTYGGEDRDFSMRVGEHWRLILCGDVHIEHLCSPINRVSGSNQIFQTAYGIGRGFRKRALNGPDFITVISYAIREFIVEALAGLKHPSLGSFLAPFARMRGLAAGWGSIRGFPPTEWIDSDNSNAESSCAGGSSSL